MTLSVNSNIQSQLTQSIISVLQIFGNLQTELIGLPADLTSSFFRREPQLELSVHRHGVAAAMYIRCNAALDTYTSCSAGYLPLP
ncbi:hypothetical protein D3C85_1582170 [compost metagenome]